MTMRQEFLVGGQIMFRADNEPVPAKGDFIRLHQYERVLLEVINIERVYDYDLGALRCIRVHLKDRTELPEGGDK